MSLRECRVEALRIEEEEFNQVFSLWLWEPDWSSTPRKIIADLRPYTMRPEGVEIIQVGSEFRILFVEDRFRETGYATRNAIHWPLSILGDISPIF